MLKTLVQIVFSLYLISATLFAKEVPLVKTIEINIPYKEFSVIEFPFEIKSYSFTPFSYKRVAKDKNSSKVAKDSYNVPALSENKTQNIQTRLRRRTENILKEKKPSSINITRGKNFFKLYPKKVGNTELLVWGYKEFPIMIKFNVSKDKEITDKYIKFIDYSLQKKKAEEFESTTHEKILIKLGKSLYNKTIPKGYKNITFQKKFHTKEFEITLIRAIVGRKYKAEEYVIKNINDHKTSILKPEMFEGIGIYGVSFVNNILTPNSSTRVFIIREN